MSNLPDNTSDTVAQIVRELCHNFEDPARDSFQVQYDAVRAVNTLITQRENAAKLKGQANLIIELQNAEVIDDIDAEHWYAQIESELSPKLLEEDK